MVKTKEMKEENEGKEEEVRKGFMLPPAVVKMMAKIQTKRHIKSEVEALIYCVQETYEKMYEKNNH